MLWADFSAGAASPLASASRLASRCEHHTLSPSALSWTRESQCHEQEEERKERAEQFITRLEEEESCVRSRVSQRLTVLPTHRDTRTRDLMDDIVPILKNRAKKSRPTDSLFELDVVSREWNRYLRCMTWNKEFEFQIRQEIRLKYASRAPTHRT